MREPGRMALAIPADLTDLAARRLAGRGDLSRLGRLDVLVNNAGGATPTQFLELAPRIRVNGIAPGVVATEGLEDPLDESTRQHILDATPLHRLATVEDVAHTALWLASPGSATSRAKSSSWTAALSDRCSPTRHRT